MLYCTECKNEFEQPKTVFENHGFTSPPYEKIDLCPYCGGTDIKELPTHCRCCGAKLNGEKEYCCNSCRIKGEKMWQRQRLKRKKAKKDPINRIIVQTNNYNKTHGTNLSYGQFVSIKGYK